MGLFKAIGGAIGSTIGDQFLTTIQCEDMGNDILMVKKTNPDGILAKKSRIIVAPGQAMALYDNGKIVDATAEAGVYSFDESSSPSFFGGDFGPVFKEMWERFKFGGAEAKEQAVYFFNIKEILDNKFGTPNPVPYKDWGHPIMNPRTNSLVPMSVEVRCFGKYTFKIENPATFMSNIGGNRERYTKQELTEQMRAEVIGAFSNVMNSLGENEHKIEVLSLPNKTDEIKEIMDQEVFDEPIRNRGVKLVSFIIESLTLDEESKKKIDQYELGGDSYQQRAVLTEAYANAVQDAASNKTGSLNGFMGIGMMNMATGNMFGNMNQNPNTMQNNLQNASSTEKAGTTATQENTWTCSCGNKNTGKFCSNCGKPKEKECPKCKTINDGNAKFCKECGEKL